MIGSPEVNKLIRQIVSPVLREIGFSKVRTRNNWRYLDDSIWVLQIRSVGNHFSNSTGFPPMSLTTDLGIYYLDFPNHPNPALRSTPEVDEDGLLVPKGHHCHVRYGLKTLDDQAKVRRAISSEADRRRDDVWWVDPSGANAEAVVRDLSRSLIEYGVPLLEKPYNKRAVQLSRRGHAA